MLSIDFLSSLFLRLRLNIKRRPVIRITPMQRWKRIGRNLVHENRWFKLWADDYKISEGKTVAPYYVIEESDWVHVVALNETQEVLTVRQYRPGREIVCLELPGGAIDENEDPLFAAQRELLEETGYTARNWELIFSPFANPARQTNRIHCFFATGLENTGVTKFDENEAIESEFFAIPELKFKCLNGEFAQSMHIGMFLMTLDCKGL